MSIYRIGEFAKIVKLPVKTIRYYDEIGLLKPEEIDDFTGYRYYSEDNVKDCQLINLLKSVDFTLNEITQHKDDLTEEVLVLKMHEMVERMNLLKHKYQRISAMRESLKKGQLNEQNPKENEEILILRRKYEKRNIGEVA